MRRHVDEIAEFAQSRLSGEKGRTPTCAVTDAQFIIARAHGFKSWLRFAQHIESVTSLDSPISQFESAVNAIVSGDTPTLERLLRTHPSLATARSTREHRLTLLHYVGANGFEGYRQRCPKNAV